MRLWKQALSGVLALLMALPASLLAQVPSPIPPPPPSAPPALFFPEQLEQIAAPIALYPDPLLGQVLMAATYPLEVVQAARFIQANPALQGGPLNDALRAQAWDDSVKSLALFPQVLAMMNDRLDWTQKLGDAFLGQPRELMDAVQRLRARAQAQGTLASTPQQTVVVEQAPQPVIQIVPVNPEIVYVPVYNPVVVYGPWPYPAYPPYYYPAGWPVGRVFVSFGSPIFVGFGLWAICHWHRHVVVIDAPRYHRFTEVVNVEARRGELARVRAVRVEGDRFAWEHNALHRRGVGYRDAAIPQERVGWPRPPDRASREPFRGRGEPARADQVQVPQARVEPGRVEPPRAQSSRTDHDRAQPDWVDRVHRGRAQPPADPPRPGVQASPRPEAGRGQPVSAPRVESAPPAPEQRREPGMSQGVRGGGDARTHGDRGREGHQREGHQVIAPPSPAVRTPPPPVSAPGGAVRPPSVATPSSPAPVAIAPAPTGPPAQQRPPGGAPGSGKRYGAARETTSMVSPAGVTAPR